MWWCLYFSKFIFLKNINCDGRMIYFLLASSAWCVFLMSFHREREISSCFYPNTSRSGAEFYGLSINFYSRNNDFDLWDWINSKSNSSRKNSRLLLEYLCQLKAVYSFYTAHPDIQIDWQYSGVLFKWELFIQMRMAYLAPILSLLPLFFSGRKEASMKLSF